MTSGLIGIIKEIIRSVWNWIKKIFVKIFNFFRNVVCWFRDPNRLRKLQEDENIIAVAIKERLENGNYNVINCLFDKERCELVDYEEDALIIESEQLDKETLKAFGEKDMIVLQ